MQVEDPRGKIIMSEEIDLLDIPETLGKLIKSANAVSKVVVAPLPKEGDIIEHNGLKFEVCRIMNRNRFLIKLVEAVEV